jgi:hypothetical protein
MEPNISETQRSELSINNFSDCPRQTCKLRVVDGFGYEECLMESVRKQWPMPSAANYCKDPVSRRFVERLHMELLHQHLKNKRNPAHI